MILRAVLISFQCIFLKKNSPSAAKGEYDYTLWMILRAIQISFQCIFLKKIRIRQFKEDNTNILHTWHDCALNSVQYAKWQCWSLITRWRRGYCRNEVTNRVEMPIVLPFFLPKIGAFLFDFGELVTMNEIKWWFGQKQISICNCLAKQINNI